MDKNNLEEYINKLKNLEKTLSEENSEDVSFIQELDGILNNLTKEVENNYKSAGYSLEVKIKKLNENAVIPKYSKNGDAGLDLIATSVSLKDKQITYGTGLSMEIPNGYVGLVFPRSSIRKYDLSLSNSVGVIDSGYRGEIMATFNLKNPWSESDIYKEGDRVAQIMIIPYPKIKFIESNELSDSDRGDGGFGSTGN